MSKKKKCINGKTYFQRWLSHQLLVNKMTKTEFAKKLGFTQPYVTQMFQGKRKLSKKLFTRILQRCSVHEADEKEMWMEILRNSLPDLADKMERLEKDVIALRQSNIAYAAGSNFTWFTLDTDERVGCTTCDVATLKHGTHVFDQGKFGQFCFEPETGRKAIAYNDNTFRILQSGDSTVWRVRAVVKL